MFDCQNCSLASITFLIQVLGLVVAVSFRLRSQTSFANLSGLMLGIMMMAVSSVICLFIDPSLGTVQGVTLVAVAIGTTINFGDRQTVTF